MDIQWESILGHERTIRQLRRLWQEGRMPHAMLFCGAEGIENVTVASAFRSSFGDDYGLTLTAGPMRGLLARTVIVADADGIAEIRKVGVTITELTPEQLAQFRAATKPVAEKVRAKLDPAVVKLLDEEMAKAEAKHLKK